MSKVLQITLGVLTAVGGFVDIGELVFAVQAGQKFHYLLLWTIVLGTLGIIIFSEMSGRIAAVIKKPVFTLVKEVLPTKLALAVLVASTLLNGLTCAAELGGLAVAFQLLLGISNFPAIILTLLFLGGIIWILPFEWIERVFGLLGLFLCFFLVATFAIHPDFMKISFGLIPTIPQLDIKEMLTYFYFAVGLVSTSMMPYEVYFYSSGGIEEKWKPADLSINKITSGVGMSLGAILAMSLIVLGSDIFGPKGIIPQLHGTSALMAAIPFGKVGLFAALLGIIFAVGGAAVETCLAGAYNIAQYFNWKWGRYLKPEQTPLFTLTWIIILVIAFVIMMFGIDPIQLVEYAVIFSVIALPFTYYPVLKIAENPKIMGKYRTKAVGKILGWFYLILVTVVALAAIPLMILTNMGQS